MTTKAEWLREFADAMEADPEWWWKQYEYIGFGEQEMQQAHSERELLNAISEDRIIRRTPLTVTREQAAEIERLQLDGIHTCHANCPRTACVLRRRVVELQERLEARIAELEKEAATARAETWALRRYVDRLLGHTNQGETDGT